MDPEHKERLFAELENRLIRKIPPELPIGQEELPAGTKIVTEFGLALLKSNTKDEVYYWDDYCDGNLSGEIESAKFLRQSIRQLSPEGFNHAWSIERSRAARDFNIKILIPRYEEAKRTFRDLPLLSEIGSDLSKAIVDFEFCNQSHPFLEKVAQCWRAGGTPCGIDGDSREHWPKWKLVGFWPWPGDPTIEGEPSIEQSRELQQVHSLDPLPPDETTEESLKSADYWQIVNEDGANGFWASDWFNLLDEMDELEPICEERIPDPTDPKEVIDAGRSSVYVSVNGEVVGTIISALYDYEHDFDSDDEHSAPDWPVVQLASLTAMPHSDSREPMLKVMEEIAQKLNETLSVCSTPPSRNSGSVLRID